MINNDKQVLTRDSVTVTVDAVVYCRIRDAIWSVCNVDDVQKATKLLAQTTLRNMLGMWLIFYVPPRSHFLLNLKR